MDLIILSQPDYEAGNITGRDLGSEIVNAKSKSPILIFLLFVFALSWPFLVYGFGWFSSKEDVLGRYILSCLGMLMVALAAFITRAFVERQGFKDVGWNLGHYKWYLATLVFCILLWLGPPLAALPFGKLEWNHNLSRDELIEIILSLGGVSLLAGFGEEFGWRGYLLPRLLLDRKLTRRVLLVIGLIWGIWHCAVAVGPLAKAGLQGAADWPAMIVPAVVSCVQMVVTSVALSSIFGTVWLKYKSIFLSSFLHGYLI